MYNFIYKLQIILTMSKKRKREFSIEKASNDELRNLLSTIVREQHRRKRLVKFVTCTKEELKTIDEPSMVVNDDEGLAEKIGYFKGYNALTECQKKRVNAFRPCCYKYGQPCNILTIIFENGEWFNKTEKWKECNCEESILIKLH